MQPYYDQDGITLYLGDSRIVVPALSPHSIAAVVTDPPYELGFMGRAWDRSGIANSVDLWRAVLAVLSPGGHLLSFGGTRTYHRMACAVEDAGFEIRDCIAWLYGQGFPKSLDVGKALDKAAGMERVVLGIDEAWIRRNPSSVFKAGNESEYGGNWKDGAQAARLTAPATDLARQWDGWGTALKPGHEPIVLARAPLTEPTVAANVARHSTGALNINGARIGAGHTAGRWPANVALSHTLWCADACADGCPVALLDAQSGERRTGAPGITRKTTNGYGGGWRDLKVQPYPDNGGASRFFYCSKASPAERSAGLDGRNDHPTVKPLALMCWLLTLVAPPGGVVLDCFAGSGTTLVAAQQLGITVIGIEQDERACEIAVQRLTGQAIQRGSALGPVLAD